MIEIREITSNREMSEVNELMDDAEHPHIPANMSVYRDNTLIGALAVNSIPLVQVFMDPRRAYARDSRDALKLGDELARIYGYHQYLVLCPEESPYYPFMERLGFTPKGHSHIFHRRIV